MSIVSRVSSQGKTAFRPGTGGSSRKIRRRENNLAGIKTTEQSRVETEIETEIVSIIWDKKKGTRITYEVSIRANLQFCKTPDCTNIGFHIALSLLQIFGLGAAKLEFISEIAR